jgi:hypothetical protein
MKKRDKQNRNKDDDVLWQEVVKTGKPVAARYDLAATE